MSEVHAVIDQLSSRRPFGTVKLLHAVKCSPDWNLSEIINGVIYIMNRVTSLDFSKTCRLCLTTSHKMSDIFGFAFNLGEKIADVIMKCTSVQIKKDDKKPNFICPQCLFQLGKVHQFQMQVVQSDRTLENYLQNLHTSGKRTKPKSSIRILSKELINQNSEADITVKCEPSEVNSPVDEVWKEKVDSDDQMNEEFLKYGLCSVQIKEESTELYPNTECFEGSKIDSENFESSNTVNKKQEHFLNFEICNVQIKEEPADFINTNLDDTLANAETNVDDAKTNVDTSEKFEFLQSVKETEFLCRNADNNLIHRQEKVIHNPFSAQLNNLNQRKLIHTGEQLHKCDICSKSFVELQHLKEHELSHASENVFTCDICNKCFAKPQTLIRHKTIHTGEKPHRCDVCDKGFNRRNDLKQHKLLHTGEKPYQCDICYKRFNKMCNLKTHRMLHSEDKPFKCDICNKGFVQLKYVKIHQLQHTGEKPYQCDICKKGFTKVNHLKHHKMTHTGEKAFRCDICNKCFTEACHLKVHQRLHTGEKPYKCDVCDKSYIQLSGLKYHQLKHSDEKPQLKNV